jgi:predicted HicB family RNase H-like nuclease
LGLLRTLRAIFATPTSKNLAWRKIEYSDEDQCLVGHIAGIADVIGSHADNVADLRIAVVMSYTNGGANFYL